MFTVYLAGSTPMRTPKFSAEWREYATNKLLERGVKVLDPFRFQHIGNQTEDGLHDKLVPDSFIVDVDIRDIRSADAVLMVYRVGLPRQSVGTWAELGIAVDRGIPVVLVTDDPNVIGHPFVQRRVAIVVKDVDEGLKWIYAMLPSQPTFGIL